MGFKRVLVVDWDVHHGNGTQHIFDTDENIVYFSVHRYDHGKFYPGSNSHSCTDGAPEAVGKPPAEGRNINIGWNAKRMGDADYLAAWQQVRPFG